MPLSNTYTQIVLEMRKTKMLDQQLQETQNVLGSTRAQMGGIYAAKQQAQTIQMRIKLLENRLEKAYVKYNQSVTHNKQLRDQINNLRRENLMFQSINSNLERELQKLKKDMAETIQLANVAFEAKEKAIQEMNVLKVQADKELQGFEEEWKHLTAIIEEDKRERVSALGSCKSGSGGQQALKLPAGTWVNLGTFDQIGRLVQVPARMCAVRICAALCVLTDWLFACLSVLNRRSVYAPRSWRCVSARPRSC